MLLPQEGHPKASAIDASLQPSDTSRPPITLVIHGGAGNASPSGRDEAAYRHGMRLALAKGYAVLERGGSALDAVTVAVSALEDDENFNAGRGAVFNSHGNIEMEASIMTSKPPRATERSRQDEKDASTLDAQPASIGDTSLLPDVWQPVPDHRRCMSATLLRHARNPIQLVRALYLNPEDAPHPYLSSSEAEVLGFKLHGSRPAPPSYFWTRRRWLEHRRGLGLPDDLPYPVEAAQEIDLSSLRGDAQGGQHLGAPPPSYSEQTPSLYQSSDARSHKRSSFESSGSSDGPQTPSSSERGGPSDSRGQEPRTSTEVNEDAEVFDPASLPQGTVGAVALDTHGTVACATSTGGKTNKMQGRIGDTCTPGAGFWAEEWSARASAEASQPSGSISTLRTSSERSTIAESISSGSAVSTRSWAALVRRVFCCRSVDVEEDLERSPPSIASQKLRSAQPSPTPTLVAHRNPPSAQRRGLAVSGTGDGDYFLRLSAASHLAHRAQFLGESLSTAAQRTVEALGDIGGVGGFIGVDTDGQVTFALNSTTLNRGYMSSVDGAVPKTAIWADDQWE